jgi:hypothetical protein
MKDTVHTAVQFSYLNTQNSLEIIVHNKAEHERISEKGLEVQSSQL